jgi:peptidoglycan hydrolase-like protein with peptidoglycan-binding domain
MEGPDVLEVQIRLKSWGFDPGCANGIFNLTTYEALRQFQQTYKITEDGVVGPETWEALTKNEEWVKDSAGMAIEAASRRIHVHVDSRLLTFINNGALTTYPVAIGKPSTPTPVGNWTVVAKAVDPGGPFGVRWMRLSVPWGGYGIHGTNNPNSIGKAVSHGCVRLYNEDVVELYNQVPIGTPVIITGEVRKIRVLKVGMRGEDVRQVQQMLYDLNYYRETPTGYYGSRTRRAVMAFQKDAGLKEDGRVGLKTYKALQIAHDQAWGDYAP